MLRDRDAVITKNKMIFRVYGYTHPPKAFVCDPEYAPADIYTSTDPRAYRARGRQVYYKFYMDEGLRFVREKYPQYLVWLEPLRRNLVGAKEEQIFETRQPDRSLQSLLLKQPTDTLLQALQTLSDLLQKRSNLSRTNFGVFGSLLHNFYHPNFSDLDLVIYGRLELKQLKETLETIYREEYSPLRNEFDSLESVKGKHWKFQNYNLKEYTWHQRRKQIYAIFTQEKGGRTIKAEFEPVKQWDEIQNEYDENMQITQEGWIRLLGRITDDEDAPFMPSTYQIEPLKIIEGKSLDDIKRVVSYVEEFRMQAQRDEKVYVEGNLEKVSTPKQTFHQIILTYGPRYYEQTLKVAKK